MEFIDGMDLDRYLEQQRQQKSKPKGKRPTYPMLLSIMRDIAYAMDYIHSQNVLHLDLRCANVMVRMQILLFYPILFPPILLLFHTILFSSPLLTVIDRPEWESLSERFWDLFGNLHL